MNLYAPSPAIPVPSLKADRWARIVDSAAREASRLVGKAERNGGKLGVGDASRYLSLHTTLSAMEFLTPAQSKVAAASLGPLLGELGRVAGEMEGALPLHAAAAVDDLDTFLRAAKVVPKVADTGALAALAARTRVAMTADWQRLAERTKDGIVEGVTRAMAGGLSPADAATVMREAVGEVGGLTHARALTIARTEMADLYDASRMGFMQANADVVDGWVWRARPDACGICQIQHARFFTVQEPPMRHHNCRCLMVPVPHLNALQEAVTPGDYLTDRAVVPGGPLDTIVPRTPASIRAKLPKAWAKDLPDDFRTLIGTTPNTGWRPSLTLVRPTGVPGRVPTLPPAGLKPPTPVDVPVEVLMAEQALRVEGETLRAEFAARGGFGKTPVDPAVLQARAELKAAQQQLDDAEAAVRALNDAADAAGVAPDPKAMKAAMADRRKAYLRWHKADDGAVTARKAAEKAGTLGGVTEGQIAADYERLTTYGERLRAHLQAQMGAPNRIKHKMQMFQPGYTAEKTAKARATLDRLRGTGSSTVGQEVTDIPKPFKSIVGDDEHQTVTVLGRQAREEALAAHQVYPTDWLEDHADFWSRVQWGQTERGFNDGRRIVVSSKEAASGGRTFFDTAVHEMGHSLEELRSMKPAEYAFWRRRTGTLGTTKRVPVREADGAWFPEKTGLTPDEYTMKFYGFTGEPEMFGSAGYEVFTTLVQQLLGGRDAYSQARRNWYLDDDAEAWLWGVLMCL